MVTAIYPGTFDPITNGHIDIAERAARMFDRLIIAVAESKTKNTLFSNRQRLRLVNEALSDVDNIDVLPFSSLVTDFATANNVSVIVRGLRTVSDFEYEFQMAMMNRQLIAEIETIFFLPKEKLGSISSNLVREISSFGGDVGSFVPASVLRALKEKHSNLKDAPS